MTDRRETPPERDVGPVSEEVEEAPVEPADLQEQVDEPVEERADEAIDDVVDEAVEAVAEVVDDVARLKIELAERTADLQRLQAEFLNYKRRVDRDRELIRENATYAALAPITEVLDTIDRAREHGPLDDGLKAVAEQLERTVARLGLTKFGAVGDPFDPTIHEALSHIGEDPEVAVTTCKVIAKSGYKIGGRVVRAAQVLVVDPVTRAAEAEPEPEPATQDNEE